MVLRCTTFVWGLCKCFRVIDTVDTTTCGTQRRDRVGNITNCYQTCSGFTPMSEYCLSQMMLFGLAKFYWINAAVVFQKASKISIRTFPFYSSHEHWCKGSSKSVVEKYTLTHTHTPEVQATICTVSIHPVKHNLPNTSVPVYRWN